MSYSVTPSVNPIISSDPTVYCPTIVARRSDDWNNRLAFGLAVLDDISARPYDDPFWYHLYPTKRREELNWGPVTRNRTNPNREPDKIINWRETNLRLARVKGFKQKLVNQERFNRMFLQVLDLPEIQDNWFERSAGGIQLFVATADSIWKHHGELMEERTKIPTVFNNFVDSTQLVSRGVPNWSSLTDSQKKLFISIVKDRVFQFAWDWDLWWQVESMFRETLRNRPFIVIERWFIEPHFRATRAQMLDSVVEFGRDYGYAVFIVEPARQHDSSQYIDNPIGGYYPSIRPVLQTLYCPPRLAVDREKIHNDLVKCFNMARAEYGGGRTWRARGEYRNDCFDRSDVPAPHLEIFPL